MNDKHVSRGIRTRFFQLALAIACAIASATSPTSVDASDGATHCAELYDPHASYPALPDARDPDVSGETSVIMYLHDHRAVVELDGCFHVVDRPLLIDFAGLEFVTLVVELPDRPEGAQVYVTQDDRWVETLDVSGSMFSYILRPGHALGFEIALPGQSAPTAPVVVSKPTGGNPKPR